MADPVAIDSQDPLRAPALQPLGGAFDYACRDDIIALSRFVRVLVEGGDDHAGLKRYLLPEIVRARVFVREAKDIAEEAIEVGTQAHHSALLARRHYAMTPLHDGVARFTVISIPK